MGVGRLELKRQPVGRKGGKLQFAALDAEKLRIAGHQVQAVEGLGLEVAVIGPEQRRGKAQLAIEDIALQPDFVRSEEHTSELQSLMRISYAVFCLKNKITNIQNRIHR